MKRKITSALAGTILFLLFSFQSIAQVQVDMPYSFSTSLAATITTPTIGTTGMAANTNDGNSVVIGPGAAPLAVAPAFTGFPFAGTIYTGFYVSSNGWIGLTNLANGSAAPTNSMPVNNLTANAAAAAGIPVIAPCWDDLKSTSTGYGWNGTTGELWIRWIAKWDSTNAAATTFYARLRCATGGIDFIWTNTAYTPINASASMGIGGPCTGDYYSIRSTFAAVDSTVENNTINTRPFTASNFTFFTFTPRTPANDACAGAISLGTINGTCTPVQYSTINATNEGTYGNVSCSPGGTDNKDVWFSFVRPAGSANVRITTSAAAACPILVGTSIEAFTGTCGAGLLTSIGCSTSNGASALAQLDLARNACTSETIFIRVTGDGNAGGKFQLCVQSVNPTGATCANATPVCTPLPYNITGLSTSGYGNDYDSTLSVCHSQFLHGQDYVFQYTPSVTQCVQISIGGTGLNSNPGLFVYDGCPNDTINTHCVADANAVSDTVVINSVSLVAGVSYYFVVDNNSAGGSIPFNFHISTLGTSAPVNDACSAATNLGTVLSTASCNYGASFYTTECATPLDSSAGYPNPLCGGYATGRTGDVWFTFTAGYTGNAVINTIAYSINPMLDGGMAVYTGACGSLSLFACDDNASANPNMPSLTIPVTNGTVYHIRMWSANGSAPGTFQICISGNCSQPNDNPCNAILLTLGTPLLGDNSCSSFSAANEPPVSSMTCGSPSTVNSVWFKVVMPASGQVKVRTSMLTLNDTQIYAYLFPGGCAAASTSYSMLICNDDTPFCSSTSYDSQVIINSAPGNTVYILVDGYANYTGTFYIVANDPTLPYPPVTGKDCGAPATICSNTPFIINNPGIHGIGNLCDFNTNACSAGATEIGSTWLQFSVNPGSAVGFTITPTDFASPSANYDFLLWDITGQSLSTVCSSISTLTPKRCNFSATAGLTGCAHPTTANFADTIGPYASQHDYLLCILYRNELFNTIGYTLDWNINVNGSTIGITDIPGTSSSITWNGNTNNVFGTTSNWTGGGGLAGVGGSCPVAFGCGVNATIAATATQPTYSGGPWDVQDLTINAGATLTIATGSTLRVCGSFTNNGTLIAQPGSTVMFRSNSTQTISGNLTGANAFANLTITKTGGSVTLNNDIDVKGNFITSNANSIFDINNKYMKVAGDFTNNTGNSVIAITQASGTGATATLTFPVQTSIPYPAGSTIIVSGMTPAGFNGPQLVTVGTTSTVQFSNSTLGPQTVAGTISVANTFPYAPSGTVEFNGTTNQTFTNQNGFMAFSKIKMNQTAGNRLYLSGANSSIYIDSTLTLTSGIISTRLLSSLEVSIRNNGQPVTVAVPITGYSSNSYIEGKLRRKVAFGVTQPASPTIIWPLSLDYPVGDSYKGYQLANVSMKTSTLIPDIMGYFTSWDSIACAPPLGPAASECLINSYDTLPLFDNGYWTFLKTGASFLGMYKMSLYNNGLTNATGVGFTVVKATTASNPCLQASWGLTGKCVIGSTAGGVQRDTINSPTSSSTSFNLRFASAQTNTTPLPIELLYFTADPEKEGVQCAWETASEINNNYFIVERSLDALEFIPVSDQIKGYGSGTSTQPLHYSFFDRQPPCIEVIYYRLKQVDLDGKFSYSSAVAVHCNNKDVLSLYPNPANTEINVNFYQQFEGMSTVTIVDILGKTVAETNYMIHSGYNSVNLKIDDLASGVYYLKLTETGSENNLSSKQVKFLKY